MINWYFIWQEVDKDIIMLSSFHFTAYQLLKVLISFSIGQKYNCMT